MKVYFPGSVPELESGLGVAGLVCGRVTESQTLTKHFLGALQCAEWFPWLFLTLYRAGHRGWEMEAGPENRLPVISGHQVGCVWTLCVYVWRWGGRRSVPLLSCKHRATHFVPRSLLLSFTSLIPAVPSI